ncbi:hypothetical protein, partial [Bacillus pumilus]|uniref:hypothetical protein n=1 Tax=Bacillus pumilus TaxID=1408 RepID=UPI001C97D6F9
PPPLTPTTRNPRLYRMSRGLGDVYKRQVIDRFNLDPKQHIKLSSEKEANHSFLGLQRLSLIHI